jgi:hypothetical protein
LTPPSYLLLAFPTTASSSSSFVQVAQLRQLEKLTLPFPLAAPHLRLLSHLPNLQELYSWRQIELDVLGPAHEPLLRVTRLVAGSINGHGKSLAACFPNLETLCLKHCSDLAALSLRGCAGLQELLAGECGQLSNDGFGCLRGLRALQRLQMEGASQVGMQWMLSAAKIEA